MTEFSTRLNRSCRINRFSQFIATVLAALFLMFYLFYMVYAVKVLVEAGEWLATIVSVLIFLLLNYSLLRAILPFIKRPFTRVRMTQEGIWLIQPLCRDMLFPWGAFQQVCIIDDNDIFLRRSKQHPATLLLVKWGASQDRKGYWNTTDLTKTDMFISIDYDAEIQAAISALYFGNIADLRKHSDNKYTSI